VGTDLSRRAFVLGGTAAVLSGCTSGSVAVDASRSSTPGATKPTSQPTDAPSQTTALPSVKRWRPDPGDVVPAAKRAAVRTIERHGNSADAALEVIDAQYGGILTESACVLVVCRQWWRRADGTVHAGGSTFDVRLVRRGNLWRVTAIHPSRPGAPTAHLSATARQVLDHGHIVLPPASVADVRSGQVHDRVLNAMLVLARTYRLGVSVVRSGHPIYVFGTNRLSDHPQGRAFDTWQIDGHMVVDPATPRQLVAAYMEAAAAAGSYNVGGPLMPGPAPPFFSDATHHDHVHAGFTT
jgi:hypothetical protein